MAESVTFVFEDKNLKEEFMGWLSDGGGEDNYYDAMDMRDVESYVEYNGDVITITNSLEDE